MVKHGHPNPFQKNKIIRIQISKVKIKSAQFWIAPWQCLASFFRLTIDWRSQSLPLPSVAKPRRSKNEPVAALVGSSKPTTSRRWSLFVFFSKEELTGEGMPSPRGLRFRCGAHSGIAQRLPWLQLPGLAEAFYWKRNNRGGGGFVVLRFGGCAEHASGGRRAGLVGTPSQRAS